MLFADNLDSQKVIYLSISIGTYLCIYRTCCNPCQFVAHLCFLFIYTAHLKCYIERSLNDKAAYLHLHVSMIVARGTPIFPFANAPFPFCEYSVVFFIYFNVHATLFYVCVLLELFWYVVSHVCRVVLCTVSRVLRNKTY